MTKQYSSDPLVLDVIFTEAPSLPSDVQELLALYAGGRLPLARLLAATAWEEGWHAVERVEHRMGWRPNPQEYCSICVAAQTDGRLRNYVPSSWYSHMNM